MQGGARILFIRKKLFLGEECETSFAFRLRRKIDGYVNHDLKSASSKIISLYPILAQLPQLLPMAPCLYASYLQSVKLVEIIRDLFRL